MARGRKATENATKRQCRELVTQMRQTPAIGFKSGDWTYSIRGEMGKYLIIERKREEGGISRIEVDTIYATDLVDMVYNNGDNKAVKVVQV